MWDRYGRAKMTSSKPVEDRNTKTRTINAMRMAKILAPTLNPRKRKEKRRSRKAKIEIDPDPAIEAKRRNVRKIRTTKKIVRRRQSPRACYAALQMVDFASARHY